MSIEFMGTGVGAVRELALLAVSNAAVCFCGSDMTSLTGSTILRIIGGGFFGSASPT